jgi:outer membrane protein assembly factor BamB
MTKLKTIHFPGTSVFLMGAIIFTLSFTGTLSAQSYFSDKVEKLWQSKAIFQVPESVFFNTDDQMIYVANINGEPTGRDENGFISLLEADGRIVRLEWVTGLHAPKGMNVFDGKLYVADIYRVAEINIKTGKIIRYFEAEGAQFLNDIVADDDGNIYITDMNLGAVYRISEGELKEWIPAGTFEVSNGLYYLDGMIYLGAKGKIVSIHPQTKEIKTIASFEGGVDGLEIDMEGNFIFSDWSGKVQMVKPGGQPEVLFNTTENKINAADIHLIRKQNILLVPTFFDNRVMAYKLSK